MSGLSNIIESFIIDLISQSHDGVIEIQRNEMAEQFECAPSQINYVLSTRFTPYKGYYIESKRGGGGYIKVIKVALEDYENIDDILIDTIGQSITINKAYHIIEGFREEGIITKREEEIIKIALSDRALTTGVEDRNRLRAEILKNIILILIK